MAIQVIHGADSGALPDGWGGNTLLRTTGGRFGGGIFASGSGNNSGTLVLPNGTRSKGGMHFGLYCLGALSVNTIMNFNESGTAHVTLTLSGTNKLRVSYPGGTADSSTTIAINTWYGVEIYVEISDTVGVIKVWVNGNLEINVSGADTRNGGSGIINAVSWSTSMGGINEMQWDDFVYYDDASPATTAPIGDVRVETLFPSGNGATSQWVNDLGNSTNNSTHVDEASPNGDTDYVESSTVGNKDTYAMTDLSVTGGTVLGVAARLYSKKTDAGTRQIAAVYRTGGGTEAVGGTITLGSGYANSGEPTVQETKPGGGAWTISDVNSAEVGVKVIA